MHGGRGEGVVGGSELGFLQWGRFLSMSPCCTRAAHICTLVHSHAHALAQIVCRWGAGSPVPGDPGCSSFGCPQHRLRASRGGVEEAGGIRGATIPRGKRESGANTDPPIAPLIPPFSPGVAEVMGSLRSGREARSRGRAERTRGGRGKPREEKQAYSVGRLTLRSIFLLFGLGHLSTHRSQLA